MRLANRIFCLCRVVNNDGAWQAAARKLREDLPAIAAAMLSDPAQADAYHRIMSSAFMQGLVKEPSK